MPLPPAMPIGASDFARDWYSLDDTPGDDDLSHFSIARDEGSLIPYIRAAVAYAPNLRVWGSPWSPPAWLKQNNDYHGGSNRLKTDPATFHTYARYLAKYVQAYQKAGVHVYAVHVQNEPAANQGFPSCLWDGALERDFIRDDLGPEFRADQWAGRDAIGPTHDRFPSVKLMQTETECGGGENNWGSAAHTWGLLVHYLTHGANAYMYWNMVLDQNSTSSWGWRQNAMVTIHTDTHAVTGRDDLLAFRNPDGAIVVVTANLDNSPAPITLHLAGRSLPATLPAQSFNTIVYKSRR